MQSRLTRLPESTSTAQLLDLLANLNQDPEVNGILVQLPLPRHVDAQAVLDAVTPLKDVDAFAPEKRRTALSRSTAVSAVYSPRRRADLGAV